MMNKWIAALSCGLPVAAMSALAFAEEMQGAHIVVSGPAKRVYEFHSNLKALVSALLVDGNLANAGVACSYVVLNADKDCDTLAAEQADRTNLTLDYLIYRDLPRLTAFVAAWAKVQDQKFSTVTMKFDMEDIVAGDCTDPTFAIQPCTNATWCSNTFPKRCDKVSGAPCTSCGKP